MLSKQMKHAYIKMIVFIIVVTLIVFTSYSLLAILTGVNIVILLLILIAILMGLTFFFSILWIQLSSRFIQLEVKVTSDSISTIDKKVLEELSFAEDCVIFSNHDYHINQRYMVRAYNFKYAKIEDMNQKNYIISTDDLQVSHE